MKTGTIYSFAALLAITSLLLSSCAAAATPEPTATNTDLPPTITFTPTLASTSTATPKPTLTLTPTATINATATQRVKDFAAQVQEYVDAKYVSTANGTYKTLDDKKSSWAKLNYYLWDKMSYDPTHFIIKSDISWLSASPAADSSGCGYVFRIQDNSDHYMFFISLKGYVELATNVANRWKSLGRGGYGNPAQKGSATVVLIVEDSTFRVLVNDKLIKTYTGFNGKLATGDLAYTVLSGTNKSYGTQCKFENTELWTITK